MAEHLVTHDTSDIKTYKAIRDTAKLRPNPQGYWQIVYSFPQGDGTWRNRPFSCRTKSFTEAQDRLTRFIGDVQAKIDAARVARDPTIAELFDAYFAAKNLPPGDSLRYQKRALCKILGHLRPRDIDDQVIADYKKARVNGDAGSRNFGRALKDGSHRRALGAMKTVIRWGVKRRLVDANHVPVFEMPDDSPAKVVYMDHDQEVAFWNAAQAKGGDLALFVALGLETAARKNAIFALTWDRVNFALRTIDLHPKGRPITRKVNAVVPISKRLWPVLVAAHKAAGSPTHGRVFDTRVNQRFKVLARELGMPWVTPHVMRHTWASLAAIDGFSLFKIGKMLGDTVATVEKTYAHLMPSDLLDVVDRPRKGVVHHA
jgi:integrase